MKILFVLSSGQFIYGANRSISSVLRNIDYDFDIMVCKSFTVPINEEEIRKILGERLNRIHICWLPRYRCYHFDKLGIVGEISHIVNNMMAFFFTRKRDRIIKSNEYDFIHLNSLVFFPMINKKHNYIIHVREVLNHHYKYKGRLIKCLKMATGLIYIDASTKEAIEMECKDIRGLILNNPFNMMRVEQRDYDECLQRYKIEKGKVVFTMLGQIGQSKGSNFVMEAFHHTQIDAYLLIVGNANHTYAKELRRLYKEDKRIIFCGEEKDVSYIYRISDYVIRGENQFCIGRTIYEGLYAGCSVIIPGMSNDAEKMSDYVLYSKNIFFYEPSDMESLMNKLLERGKKKVQDRKYRSNIDDYMKQYKHYINEVI